MFSRLEAEERRARAYKASEKQRATAEHVLAAALAPDPVAVARERARHHITDSTGAAMAHNKQAQAEKAGGGDEVQHVVDQETKQGYRGTDVDPTPNEHYTVKGVTSGKPTPETDDKQAAEARAVVFPTSRS
jgi:hypothetical protein